MVRNNSAQKSYGSRKVMLTRIRKKSQQRAQIINSKHKHFSKNCSNSSLKHRNNLSCSLLNHLLKNEKLANCKKIMPPIWRAR